MGAALGSLCSPRDRSVTVPPIKTSRYKESNLERPGNEVDLSKSAPEKSYYEGPNLELPAKWISECVKNHPVCAEAQNPSYRPTRLIDLGSAAEMIPTRLVESSPKDKPVKYLALSYCWGSSMPDMGKTYVSTLTARKAHLDLNNLPRTFLHFFDVAKRLKVRYVWIDALCIIQDSDLDWQRESQCMGRIYSNALCTIAAESSADCQGGMWLESLPQNRNYGESCVTQEERVRLYLSNFDQRIWKSPLQARGWTLQERDLSPRVLHFTYAHLFWECRTLRTDCTAILGGCQGIIESDTSIQAAGLEWKTSRSRAFDVARASETSVVDIQSNFAGGQSHRLVAWREIVEDYSGRAFTRRSDRLPALSGLATEVEGILNCKYVAGLWTEDILLGLLWAKDDVRRSGSWRTILPSNSYEGPSWSWASFPGAIDYEYAKEALRSYHDTRGSLIAQLLEANVIPEGLDPKGRLLGGYIRLRGRARWFADPSSNLSSQSEIMDTATRLENRVSSTLGIHSLLADYHDGANKHSAMLAICIISGYSSWKAFALALLPTGVHNQFRRVGVTSISREWFNHGFDTEVTIV